MCRWIWAVDLGVALDVEYLGGDWMCCWTRSVTWVWVGCIGCKIGIQYLSVGWVCAVVGRGVGHVPPIGVVGLDVVQNIAQ